MLGNAVIQHTQNLVDQEAVARDTGRPVLILKEPGSDFFATFREGIFQDAKPRRARLSLALDIGHGVRHFFLKGQAINDLALPLHLYRCIYHTLNLARFGLFDEGWSHRDLAGIMTF